MEMVKTNRLRDNSLRLLGVKIVNKECPICYKDLIRVSKGLWKCPVHGIFNLEDDDDDRNDN